MAGFQYLRPSLKLLSPQKEIILLKYQKVVITGLGAVTPIGLCADEFWCSLVNGRSGIYPITHFDATKFPVKVAAEVKGFSPEKFMELKRVDRGSRPRNFAIAAAKMAINSAKLNMAAETTVRVGVVVATGGAPSLLGDQGDLLKARGPNRIDPLLANKVGASMVGVQVGMETGARGPNTTLNSACASGSDSLGIALSHIRMGHADVMIAGGSKPMSHLWPSPLLESSAL